MAVLDSTERARIARLIQRDANLGVCAFTKPDLVAAIAALDDFLDTNAASINSALPQPFRGAATVQQKALLLAYVVLRRYGGDPTALGGE